MKHKLIIGLEVLLASVILATGVTVFANQAGSEADPLVTKSYVDDKINKALETINSSSGNTGNININTISYTPVYATVGQTLYGKEGTEIILRSGKGVAIVPTAEGISNITTGQDLRNNVSIGKNHLLITPRDDGRGIKVTENAWFLVKGDYVIK
ncbi:MAG: hypothetical protein K2F59_01110 [Eubacteriales bacterium]|nr:hypothetical protein [Eubacteriales bacterium]